MSDAGSRDDLTDAQYLQRLEAAEGIEAEDAAALRRMDHKRSKKMSNEEWISPNDPEAEITRLKDGRTALAYKAAEAVDMQSAAIAALTTHGGAAADTETIQQTACEAGRAVAELTPEKTPQGEYEVPKGIAEAVADKGYHNNEALRELHTMKVWT